MAHGQAWTPPLGIPAPPFGVTQTAGAFTHYVDNTAAGATDTGNPNGSPARPRRTIPSTLAAGSVVEVRGGPYIYNFSGAAAHTLNGTATAPVFIRGVGAPVFTPPSGTQSERDLGFAGSYYIVEGLKVDARGWMGVRLTGNHGVFRDSEVFGMGSNFNPVVSGDGSFHVMLRNYIHDNGPVPTPQEFDVHGAKFSAGNSNIWILDNRFERNAGDDVQIGDDCIGGSSQCLTSTATWPANIYIGRNTGNTGGENCIDIKQAKDVIISQNECWNFHPGGTSDGAAGITHNAAQRVWWIFNKIHDSEIGIRVNSNLAGDDGPSGGSVYVLGNLFYGIRSAGFRVSDGYSSGAAIVGWNNQTVHVVDNTITNSDRCIGLNSVFSSLPVLGNLCDGAKSSGVFVALVSQNVASINYSLFSPTTSVRWGSSTYSTPQFAGQCANCRTGAALLDGTYRPTAQSPAIGANVRHSTYALFQSTYGRSIDFDQSGLARNATVRTIGAYEASFVVPDVSIADTVAVEGNTGQTTAWFTVTFSEPTTRSVTVGYATANGTATAGSDYLVASGTLVFPPGSVSQRLPVMILGDRVYEVDESFVVRLTGSQGGAIVRSQATGTITNDDATGLSVNDASAVERRSGTTTAAFTVTLSPTLNQTVTVNYATANGTATAGPDYVAASGTLTFPANTATRGVNVTINGDGVREPVETFTLNLSNPTGATIASPQGVGRIYDPGSFFTVNPCRVVDTRTANGPRGGPALGANTTRTFTIRGACGIPTAAVAVAINVTVTQATRAGDLRIYPAGTSLPTASVINYRPSQTRANSALATLNSTGQLAVRCDQPSGTAHFILDVAGYYQ
jgi:hypothetical protein